jgi:hypothetical protein
MGAANTRRILFFVDRLLMWSELTEASWLVGRLAYG